MEVEHLRLNPSVEWVIDDMVITYHTIRPVFQFPSDQGHDLWRGAVLVGWFHHITQSDAASASSSSSSALYRCMNSIMPRMDAMDSPPTWDT